MSPNTQSGSKPKPSPTANTASPLGPLEILLGHTFHDPALLSQAVTHSSLAYERASADHTSDPTAASNQSHVGPAEADNEQLEFLGDAVVGLLVAESLCTQYPTLEEGQLTRLRAALVSRRHLGEVAARLGLGQYLRLGRGEERSGGRKKNAILANSIEAIIGALYLDADLNPVRLFVEREIIGPYLGELLEQMEQISTIGDHKSALQEYLQGRRLGPPIYTIKSESGPDHSKNFVVDVSIPGIHPPSHPIASGNGATKKRAEQEAADRALRKMKAKQNSLQTHPSPAPKVHGGTGLIDPSGTDAGAPAGHKP
ncbi:MAG TPA: ribonuclease III [Acidisarcina sp.]